MDEPSSSGGRLDDDGPGSPKRRKIRAKYAPKACVSCRRSKLKCSGDNPCHRCLDNGRRCFYSEDQTAAEALQNLSRPAPGPPSSSAGVPSSNGNASVRRGILPRGEDKDRRASDASMFGSASMEARMARIEGMMEALIQDRGIGMNPRPTIDDELLNDSYPTDPMDVLSASLVPVRHQHLYPQESPELRPRHSLSVASPSHFVESSSTIRIGSRQYTFPSTTEYYHYINSFFANISPYHPCIDEVEFRARSDQVLLTRAAQSSQVGHLALNYIMFACVDILADASPQPPNIKPAGWYWFKLAEELVGKRLLSGHGDENVLRVLIWESCYFIYADQPNAAYGAIGSACRLCFQLDLHQQSVWTSCSREEETARQSIFWAIYCVDRWVSLSLGRPYGIRDSDFETGRPAWILERTASQTDHYDAESLHTQCSAAFQLSMMAWSKLAGDVWDHCIANTASKQIDKGKNASVLDNTIERCAAGALQKFGAMHPGDRAKQVEYLRYRCLVRIRFNHLRLVLLRKAMLSLIYDGDTGRIGGELLVENVQDIKQHSHEAKIAGPFRVMLISALGSAILLLATLLVRDLPSLGLRDRAPAFAEGFRAATRLLQDFTPYLQLARRIADDLKDIINVVNTILNGGPPEMLPTNVADLFRVALYPASHHSTAREHGMWDDSDSGAGESWDWEVQHHASGSFLFI